MNDRYAIDSYEETARERQSDLRAYWRAVGKHKWGILGIVFVVGLLSALVAFSKQPVYRATAVLLIEAQPAKVVSIEQVYSMPGANLEYYQTQYEILRSRTLAEDVVSRVRLWEAPEFDPTAKDRGSSRLSLDWRSWVPSDWLPEAEAQAYTEASLKEAAVGGFLGRLHITLVPNTQLARIAFDAHDPRLAARVANTVAEAYIENNLEARLQMTQKAASWLTVRLSGLRKKVEESERQLQEFRDQEQLVDVQGVKTLSAKELDAIAAQLVEARRRRAEAEALYEQVRSLKGAARDRYEVIRAVLRDSLVQGLKTAETQAERKVSELAKRYGPKHPKMIAAVAELETARRSLRKQIATVIDGIAKEYELAKANEADLVRSMEAAKGRVQDINRDEYRLGALEREVEANRQLYQLFLTRFKEMSEAEQMQSANARVVDPALVPGAPYMPNRTRIIFTAVLWAALIGVALAFLLEHLDNTLKSAEDVEEKLGLPLLGALPRLKVKNKQQLSPVREFMEHSQSNFSEAVRTIRTGISLSALDNPHQVVVVTSSLQGEGKTTLAMNLAMAMGQMEKVLLIDGDMRQPAIAKAWGIDESAPGLSHFTAGTARISECVHPMGDSRIYVMPAGLVPPNPQELLATQRFAEVLKRLTTAFHRVVIDAPPTLAVSDALVISRHASGVIYVVKADQTPYQVAKAGLKRLRQMEAPLIGVVLNDARMKAGYSRYGGYSADYYTQYG